MLIAYQYAWVTFTLNTAKKCLPIFFLLFAAIDPPDFIDIAKPFFVRNEFLKIEKLGSLRNKVTNPSASACQLGRSLFSKRKLLKYFGKQAYNLPDYRLGVDKGKLSIVANS